MNLNDSRLPEKMKEELLFLAFTKLRYYVMNPLGYYARSSIYLGEWNLNE